MLDRRVVSPELEFQLDSLFEALEAPITFLFFESWYTKKLVDGIFRIVCFDLLCVVVFIFYVNITVLLLFIVFIFEIIPRYVSSQLRRDKLNHCTAPDQILA